MNLWLELSYEKQLAQVSRLFFASDVYSVVSPCKVWNSRRLCCDTKQFPPHKLLLSHAHDNLWLPEHNGIVELFLRRISFSKEIYVYCRLETNQQFTTRRKTICYGRQKIWEFRFVAVTLSLLRAWNSYRETFLHPLQILPSHYLNGQLILRCTAEVGTYYADFTEAPLETTRKEPIPERGEKTRSC